MEETLAKLIALPTVTGDVAANDIALDYIERRLANAGMHTVRSRYNGYGTLVATAKPNQKTPTVMLTAHVDVIPGSKKLFRLDKRGDKLFGRGTFDMKFAIAAYIELAEELGEHIKDYDFGIMITSDEELGGIDGTSGVARLLEDGYLPKVCVLPDGGDDWQIETVAKGTWRFDIVAHGRTAHGSRPWEGENASYKLTAALNDIIKHFKKRGKLTNTLNVGVISGGEARNQVPALMTAEAEIRIMDEKLFVKDQKKIERICRRNNTDVITRLRTEPTINDPENPYLKEFMRSVEKITETEAGTCISYAASDGKFFTSHGVPCVITRPPGGKHHGEGEWIDREGFLHLKDVLLDYLDRVAQVLEPDAIKHADTMLTVPS